MDIYQHFRKEERECVDQILDTIDQVQDHYAPKLTDFLNPREREIVQALVGSKGDVRVEFYGGSPQAERKRALLFPEYFTPGMEDFQVTAYSVIYSSKFTTLKHRQVLGTMTSVGLKREKFGDILIQDDQVQMFVASEIASYLEMNITKMGKAGVKLRELDDDDILDIQEEWQEDMVTVTSMRLDVVLSAIAKLSRQKSQQLIQQGRVQVNWKQIEQPSFELTNSDTVSVRGFGRFKVFSIEGKSKKDKWKIQCGIQK